MTVWYQQSSERKRGTRQAPKVNGADETCVSNGVTDGSGAPIDAAVSARHQMLVAEVHCDYVGRPIDDVNRAATDLVAAIIGQILQDQ